MNIGTREREVWALKWDAAGQFFEKDATVAEGRLRLPCVFCAFGAPPKEQRAWIPQEGAPGAQRRKRATELAIYQGPARTSRSFEFSQTPHFAPKYSKELKDVF